MADKWNEAIDAAAQKIPSSWLHPHLTGERRIGNPPYTGTQIEILLLRIREEILKLKRTA